MYFLQTLCIHSICIVFQSIPKRQYRLKQHILFQAFQCLISIFFMRHYVRPDKDYLAKGQVLFVLFPLKDNSFSYLTL
jgi:hypothetical protein